MCKPWAKKLVSTSENIQCQGHNHLLTTGADDPHFNYHSPSKFGGKSIHNFLRYLFLWHPGGDAHSGENVASFNLVGGDKKQQWNLSRSAEYHHHPPTHTPSRLTSFWISENLLVTVA